MYTTFVPKKLTGIRIKERDLAELEKLAKKEDETVSSLIRQAIREFLDRRKESK
jgi:predicted transcriptional regulator